MFTFLTALSLAMLGGATPDYSQIKPQPTPVCVQKQSTIRPQVKKLISKKVTPKTAIARVVIAPGEIDALINRYAAEHKVDANLMKSIAKCESTFNPNAINGQHLGMYQYKASTWESTRRQMGLNPDPSLRVNAEEAIKTTAFKLAHGGQNAWRECL